LLEKMVGVLDRYPEVDLAVCRFVFINESGEQMSPPPFQEVGTFYDPWRDIPRRHSGCLEFIAHIGLDCPSWTSITSVVFRRRLMAKIGLFRTDCGTCADRLWAMRTACVTDTISIPDTLATWRQHPMQASWGRPSISNVKRNWQRSVETLALCEDRLPDAWKQDPAWRDLLLRNVRGQYFKRIGMDRLTLQRTPGVFLKGLAYASIYEPAYLMKRLTSGFAWDLDCFGNEEDFLKTLIGKWHVPWPPAAL
jgi:hypothetical protein